jgi:glycosyl hydrolase family 99
MPYHEDMGATRRHFLATGLGAGLAASAGALWPTTVRAAPAQPEPTDLRRRFPNLARHFVFEYYPWYGGPPDYMHWDYLGRRPPTDIASPYMPRLGPYDVRSRDTLEQHARWIAGAGIGAIALSWWGRGSWEDQRVGLILDVMRDHGLKVTFAMEPYSDTRALRYADDILYLLHEYGDKRRWDALLVLRDADGNEGPVFKGFRCILPETSTDCLGRTSPVSDYTADAVWRRQTDTLRDALRGDFDHVTLLADSLEFRRTPASGFDGIGIYDNYIAPDAYSTLAEGASRAGLVFSFNVNPGYLQIEPRNVQGDPCYHARAFAPPTEGLDLGRPDGRELAARRATERIAASFQTTLDVQTDPALSNARRGFLLVYVNSFNEWHEGHAFEPMKDAADLTPAERAQGYANPEHGDYRLRALGALVRRWTRPSPAPRHPEPLLDLALA